MRPLYLESRAGKVFLLYFPPPDGTPVKSRLLFIPPFAEELNRTRHVIAAFARGCAKRGIGVAVLDPYGTGDSEGDFSEASWDIWKADLETAVAWLEGQGSEAIAVGGLRLGATLAADVAADHPGKFQRLVLWQPVTNGQNYLKQFLRIRLAADLSEGEGQDTKTLMAALKDGQTVEVAGYELPPALALGIDGLRLGALGSAAKAPVIWLEVAAREDAPLSPAASRMIDGWKEAGIEVSAEAVPDEPVWNLQLRVEMSGFIRTAVEAMEAA